LFSDIRRPKGRRAAAGLDTDAVRAAYRRWAGVYDAVFGAIFLVARRRVVALVNQLPAREVLEVGVGTGLALPYYAADRRVTGIDLSPEMLAQARRRVAERRLSNVVALREMDAEATDFADAARIIAVESHESGQVEGRAEPCLPLLQQKPKTLVRLSRGAEPGKLPHGPQAAAIHAGVDATRERILSGETKIHVRIEAVQTLRSVERLDRDAAHRRRRNLPLARRFDFPFPPLVTRWIRYRRHQISLSD